MTQNLTENFITGITRLVAAIIREVLESAQREALGKPNPSTLEGGYILPSNTRFMVYFTKDILSLLQFSVYFWDGRARNAHFSTDYPVVGRE